MRLLVPLFLIIFCTCVRAHSLFAQERLVVDDGYTAGRLVNEVFASGQCENIFNVTRIGARNNGIGYFEAPDTLLGFGRGIVMSTGRVRDAPGPNSSSGIGQEEAGPVSDPDLQIATGRTTFDVTGIEFDFTPLQPEVSFRYVFASEEYCDFVGAEYNDFFGFFISGPGIDGPFSRGAINVALLPGTNDPVSINTVNHSRNRGFYLDNEFPSIREVANCGGPPERGPRFNDIEYDGQTVTLTASIVLQPCVTYHIRLVVGDVEDGVYDSAVFLEAGSFDLGSSVSFQDGAGGEETLEVVEGCDATVLRVARGPESPLNRPNTINYRIGDNASAQEGADFTAGSGSVTIPAGQSFAEIPIIAFDDGIAEGQETAWLVLDIPCACYTDSIQLLIQDPGSLAIGLEEAYYCPDQSATLVPRVSGGIGPYAFNWSFGSSDSTPVLMPPLPASIGLTVTDNCGQSVTAAIATFSSAPPGLSLPAQELQACLEEDQQIVLDLQGRGELRLTYRINGGAIEELRFPSAGRQVWPVTRSGNYRLLEIADDACRRAVDTTLRVDFFRPAVNPRVTPPTCAGEADGSFTVTHLPTVGPYEYRWSGVNPDSLTATNLASGIYGLTVTDALGCQDIRDISLREPDALLPVVVTCNQVRRPPLRPSATGGTPPYSYSIDGENYWTGPEGFDQLNAGNYYTLFIRDARGCERIQADFFYPRAAQRSASLPTFIPQELAGSVVVEPDYDVPLDQIVAYRWHPAAFFDCPSCPNPTLSAPRSQPISLAIDDIYGCTDSLVTFVAVDGRVPLYVPNVFTPNGDGTNDFIAVYANPEQVERILDFEVYDRWGELIWRDEDFAPNDGRRGWDGQLDGRPANLATYVWRARIRLVTGEEQVESGTTVLVAQH